MFMQATTKDAHCDKLLKRTDIDVTTPNYTTMPTHCVSLLEGRLEPVPRNGIEVVLGQSATTETQTGYTAVCHTTNPPTKVISHTMRPLVTQLIR